MLCCLAVGNMSSGGQIILNSSIWADPGIVQQGCHLQGVNKVGDKIGESKCALVYGQMNEPPGARARVALTGNHPLSDQHTHTPHPPSLLWGAHWLFGSSHNALTLNPSVLSKSCAPPHILAPSGMHCQKQRSMRLSLQCKQGCDCCLGLQVWLWPSISGMQRARMCCSSLTTSSASHRFHSLPFEHFHSSFSCPAFCALLHHR